MKKLFMPAIATVLFLSTPVVASSLAVDQEQIHIGSPVPQDVFEDAVFDEQNDFAIGELVIVNQNQSTDGLSYWIYGKVAATGIGLSGVLMITVNVVDLNTEPPAGDMYVRLTNNVVGKLQND